MPSSSSSMSSIMAIATPVPRLWSPAPPRSADASPVGEQALRAETVVAAAAEVAAQVALASEIPSGAIGRNGGGTLQHQQMFGGTGGMLQQRGRHGHLNGSTNPNVLGVGHAPQVHLHDAGGGARRQVLAAGTGWGADSGTVGVQQQQQYPLLEVPAVARWTAVGEGVGGDVDLSSPTDSSQQQQPNPGVNRPRELSPAHIQDDHANRIQPQHHQQRRLDRGEAAAPLPVHPSPSASSRTGGVTPPPPASPATANGSHATGMSDGAPSKGILTENSSRAEEDCGTGARGDVEMREAGGEAVAPSCAPNAGANQEEGGGLENAAVATSTLPTTTTAMGVNKPLSTHPWAPEGGVGGGGEGTATAAAAANGENRPASALSVGLPQQQHHHQQQDQQQQLLYHLQPQAPSPSGVQNGAYAPRNSFAEVGTPVARTSSAMGSGMGMSGMANGGGSWWSGKLDTSMQQVRVSASWVFVLT